MTRKCLLLIAVAVVLAACKDVTGATARPSSPRTDAAADAGRPDPGLLGGGG
jgi:hypothetical protein